MNWVLVKTIKLLFISVNNMEPNRALFTITIDLSVILDGINIMFVVACIFRNI